MAVTPYYLGSDLVNVFPSTRRVYTQDFSPKLMTELAISRAINMLMDTDGFVISENLNLTDQFEINIHGYYFQINNYSNITSLFDASITTTIYASILIDKSNAYPELRVPGELLQNNPPAQYNSSVSYIPGQLVTYNNVQYQCISPQDAGNWDPSKWVELVDGFQGLILTSDRLSASDIVGSDASNYNLYTLAILEKIPNVTPVQWRIPERSKFWLDLDEIDGGTI